MRRLRHIRSDGTVVIEHRSVASLCVLSLLPATAIASLAWFWQPTWSGGRALVSACLGLVAATLMLLATWRKRTLRVERGSAITWESGIESDVPYGVALHHHGERRLLLENDDPARVVADARRIARETGAVLLGPDWLLEQSGGPRDPRGLSTQHEEGLLWPTQLRTSRTTVLAGLFVLVLSAGSIRAESEISWLSAALPGLSVALALLIGFMLAKLRVHVDSGPDGLHAERRGVGAPRALLKLPLSEVLEVHAIGHASHPERHLLIETVHGPVSLSCAEAPARRIARFWSRAAGRVAGAA